VADQSKKKPTGKTSKSEPKPKAQQLPTESGWLDPPANGGDGENPFGSDLDLSELDALFNKAGDGAKADGDAEAAQAAPEAAAEEPSAGEWDAPSNTPVTPPPNIPAATAAEGGSVLDDKATFRAEAQKLAKAGDWQGLAALTSAALDVSKWATQSEIRAALLADLARVYRDRLKDLPSAEDQFRRLSELAPANTDANRFLGQRYKEKEDWKALYDLRSRAVEATWDPNQRLEWTREAATVARDRLRADDLAIEAWERLWKLGDAQEETARALSEAYRRGGHWERLAAFLQRRAESKEGAARLMALREVGEAYLSGVRDHESAATVLEQILTARTDDPVALLALARVLARRKDWPRLTELGSRRLDGVNPAAAMDLRRLVADALWTNEELERSAQVYEQILAVDPNDADALEAKEKFLVRQQKVDSLIELIVKRAESAAPAEQARLYDRAATLAEKDLGDLKLAASLLERRAELEAGRSETLQQLATVYESLGEHEGVKKTLERLIELTHNPHGRIELLRRLGEHCAHRMGDDARAERCWREILDTVPDDRAIREELTALYRRRGDFEAVDRTLAAQAWRPLDDESLATVWRASAVNLQDNLTDPARTLRAWRRVLDLRPDDAVARRAIVPHARALGSRRELIAALEAQWRTLTSAGESDEIRVQQALEIARLWEAENDRAAALAAYERVLRIDAAERTALAAVAKLRGTAEAGVTRGALDAAAARLNGADKSAVVRQALTLAEGDKREKLFVLRRLLGIGGAEGVVAELAQAANEAGAHVALASVYEELAAAANDGEDRAELHRQLAALCEGPLAQPVRAFLLQQAARQKPVTSLSELEPLLKLADQTGRHEDAVALLGIAAWTEAPGDVRRAAIRRRMTLCEQKLNDPARAFHEAARLLRIDARDGQALADAQRLAGAANLHHELDALWAELWDRATSDPERLAVARARKQLRATELKDALGALDQAMVEYRLEPTPELEHELVQQADALSAWDRVLPLLEARARAATAGSTQTLVRLGTLHHDKRKDAVRAFELYGEALLLEPGAKEIEEKVVAAAGDRTERLAAVLRDAAARASDPMRAIELYGRAAQLYTGALDQPALALDLHQRILQLQPASLESLEVVLQHHRASGLHRELRDGLQRWTELEATSKDSRRSDRLLEIARLSREQLGDYETALTTYTQILESNADDPEALAGVRSLTHGALEPALELKRLRLELGRAAGARRVEIQLACSALQETRLDDVPGAIATLRELVAESGAAGAGYEPLARLLGTSGAWRELVALMETRAAALTETRAQAEMLEQAIALTDEHPEVPADHRERLYRALLQLKPDHTAVRRRLLQLYRAGGRDEELVRLLQASEERLGGQRELAWFVVSERVRVLDRMLGKSADAEALLNERLTAEPDNAEAMLALASIQLRRGDRAGHLALRERHARLLPPRIGALVLCHLAEVADETTHDTEKVLAYYRAARALDPENKPAMEGLKALGRRSRTWRAQAALLPDPDEAQLGHVERAARLRDKAATAAKADPQVALGFYERAVAVNVDDATAWDGLAALDERTGDRAAAFAARKAALGAFERSTPPEPASLEKHADRLQQLAQLARALGDEAGALRYSAEAHELQPSLPAAALAVADSRLAAGATAEAHAIYSALLSGGRIADEDRKHASFRRGVLAARAGKLDDAIDDLREGLRVDPLHPGMLQALADVYADKGRVAAAVQHYTQALLLASEGATRGPLYARIGRLWEDRLQNPEEAGVSYDLALGAGVDQPEIMMRALAHYRRTGRKDQAARVIEHLLPRTTAPAELATLWAERGCLLADSDDGKAMEAFDMALSYDPACRPAVDGLAQLLERRGEWQQLVELLEVRVDTGSAEARAATLRSLARIAHERLSDDDRAERYLHAAVELNPQLSDYDQLLAFIGNAPEKEAARRTILAERMVVGGPWMSYLVEYGRQLAGEGRRGWAWCLLSPLMNAMIPDPAVKSLVLELRKELEKQENVNALGADLHRRVLHRNLPAALYDVLIEVDKVAVIGPRTLDAVKGVRGARVDSKVALGKMFGVVAEHLGMPDALLMRAEELPVPYRVLQGDVPTVIARADLFAVMSPHETNALFSLMLEQARPGARLLASPEAPRVVGGLLAAIGLREKDAQNQAVCEQIEAATTPEQRVGLGRRAARAAARRSRRARPRRSHRDRAAGGSDRGRRAPLRRQDLHPPGRGPAQAAHRRPLRGSRRLLRRVGDGAQRHLLRLLALVRPAPRPLTLPSPTVFAVAPRLRVRPARLLALVMNPTESSALSPAQRAMVELWERHTTAEFIAHDLDTALATMTDDPYVNHVPVGTGGRGSLAVRRFYGATFLPQQPEDTRFVLLSRTVGENQIVDELVHSFTHSMQMDWILPGVPPTGRRVEIPVCAVVRFAGGKIAEEHIYWDQASVLAQVGLLDTARLPITGVQQAQQALTGVDVRPPTEQPLAPRAPAIRERRRALSPERRATSIGMPLFATVAAPLAMLPLAGALARNRRRGATSSALGAAALGVAALGAFSAGALAMGALGVGAMAIGKLAIRSLVIRDLRVQSLSFAELRAPIGA
jgi:carboxymethylenebutenolidase